MTSGKPLSKEAALALFNESKATTRSGGTKIDPTAIRDYPHWFKLNHHIREEKCDNPDCTSDKSKAYVVALVKDKFMCRRCFLDGWLS